MTTSPLLIGVDIGGTKTHLRAQAEGRTWEQVVPSAEWRQRNWTIDARSLVSMAMTLAGGQPISTLGVGAHGCDDADECIQFQRAISREFTGPVGVVNDAELMPFAAGKPHAIGLVAGTGSIAVHRDEHDQMRVAGGWGWVIGDDGSASGLMRDAVRAIALELDENENAKDPLIRRLFDALSIPSAARIGSTFTAIGRASGAGAAAHEVFAAADEGSPLAQKVIRDGGRGLAELVHRLERRGATADHVVAGGAVIAAQPLLWETFCDALYVLCGDRITPTLFKGKPVEGALRLAESLLDTRQPSAALSRQT